MRRPPWNTAQQRLVCDALSYASVSKEQEAYPVAPSAVVHSECEPPQIVGMRSLTPAPFDVNRLALFWRRTGQPHRASIAPNTTNQLSEWEQAVSQCCSRRRSPANERD